MIPSAKRGKVQSLNGPEPAPLKDFWQFRKIQIHHEEGRTEFMTEGRKTPMSNVPFVDTALHSICPKIVSESSPSVF
jgi:hypothetical protein